MKNIYCTLILFNFLVVVSPAQAPQKMWESFYNGALTGKDHANDLITDSSGNIFVTGSSYNTFIGGSMTTIKYDPNGIQLWTDHFTNTQTSYFNYGSHLVKDKWQNVYSVGTTALHEGDLAVCKYDANGKIWEKNYEPYWFTSYDDYGIDIDVDSSGNIYAIARVNSPSGNLFDMYLIKCDSSGTKIWDNNYTGASDDDFPVAISVTPGGTAYPILQSFNFFGTATMDITTIQFLNNGTQNWTSKFNGAGNALDYPMDLKVDQSENQYITGTTDGGANNDMVAFKQNSYGTRLWVVTYNGSANGNDTAISSMWLPNGFVAITGKSKELVNGNILDAVVTMVVDSGTVVWSNQFFGSDSLGASMKHMMTDIQGNIYICGTENLQAGTKNAFLIKYESNGNLLWNISYDGGNNLNDIFNALAIDNMGNIVVTGQTFSSITNSNFVTVKYSSSISTVSMVDFISDVKIYPNPASTSSTLEFEMDDINSSSISIVDMLGKVVKSIPTNNFISGTNEIKIDLSELNNGLYFLKMTTKSGIIVKKVIIERE